MIPEQIQENNELIASFMGYYYQAGTYYAKGGGAGKWFKNAKYDTSWEWLMRVVEKIEDMGFDVDIKLQSTAIYDTEKGFETEQLDALKIVFTYRAIIDFIKWYNQQKQQP